MRDLMLSFLTGLAVGGLFRAINLPVPAPNTLAGVLGVAGLFAGFLLVERFFKR
ncbi:MAG: DUF1427 family protein [Elusimicrobia bacterium]|nr:DUF1427 family protein [Elusimicrobiota bacterium]